MQGLIFIPDISGFTNFVKSIDIDLGMSITRDLLNDMIDNNPLELNLSEIEGDALLFYKLGKPIPLATMMQGFKKMYEAFNLKYKQLKQTYNIEVDLSLKLIVHYGNLIVYNIRGFKKLYGETVIDSHRLLKNDIADTDYVLVTEDYIQALEECSFDTLKDQSNVFQKSQLFTCLKKIPYYFFSTKKKPFVEKIVVQEENWMLKNRFQMVSA